MLRFSEILRAALQDRQTSAAAFAREKRLESSSLSKILSGKRSPTPGLANAYADALGLVGRERESFLAAAAVASAARLESARDGVGLLAERAAAAEAALAEAKRLVASLSEQNTALSQALAKKIAEVDSLATDRGKAGG